jgi:hypothetical protein
MRCRAETGKVPSSLSLFLIRKRGFGVIRCSLSERLYTLSHISFEQHDLGGQLT